jgi:hypothetical protein
MFDFVGHCFGRLNSEEAIYDVQGHVDPSRDS